MGIQPILYGTNGGDDSSNDLLTLKIMSVDNEFIKEGEIDESELDYIISGNGTEGELVVIDPDKIAAKYATSIGYDDDKYKTFLTDKEYEVFGSTLKELDFPNLQRFKQGSSLKEYNVESISFPELTEITGYGTKPVFNLSGELTSDNLPKLKTIGNYAFKNATGLTLVNLPNVTTIGNNIFDGCSNVEEFNLSGLTSLGTGCFNNCTGATILSIPSAQTFAGIGIGGMTKLEEVYFPSVTSTTAGFTSNQLIKKIQLTSLSNFNVNRNLKQIPLSCACETAIDLCKLKNWNIDLQFNTEYQKYIYIWSIESMDEQTIEIPSNVTIWTYDLSSEVLEAHKGQATIVYGKTHQEFIDTFFNGRYEGPVIIQPPHQTDKDDGPITGEGDN